MPSSILRGLLGRLDHRHALELDRLQEFEIKRGRVPGFAHQKVARLHGAHDLVHPAVVIAMVMRQRHQVERLDPFLLEPGERSLPWSAPRR